MFRLQLYETAWVEVEKSTKLNEKRTNRRNFRLCCGLHVQVRVLSTSPDEFPYDCERNVVISYILTKYYDSNLEDLLLRLTLGKSIMKMWNYCGIGVNACQFVLIGTIAVKKVLSWLLHLIFFVLITFEYDLKCKKTCRNEINLKNFLLKYLEMFFRASFFRFTQ